ncbi:anti-sigma factor antagonist [Nocardiopsis ansamitocini]|uniref:Anti-sigma factor antagonist n=2 Tax=Nocardiopsis ansamitocini TaxID=1670832 RepID=A0A9W6P5G5_9ACTN|nr:STAS domain-containing protein [Nocardiopsis ansamitocini]GLU47550.1 anti-sigma factor antagonist [Nocardiopsis ansamitocini]
MPALQITTRHHDDGIVIALAGEIDIATEDDFRATVLQAAVDSPNSRVVLDCAQLTFIDSSGLRVLIQCHKAGKEHGSRLFVAAPSERIAQILRVTAIDTRIPVHPTADDALSAPLESSSRQS